MPAALTTTADGALAARLDEPAGRLAEDRDVGVQPVGQLALDAAQPVGAGLDLLAVVHHQRDVVRRLGDGGGQMQEHRVAGLHVRGAAAVQLVAVGEPAGQVVGGGHGVGVAGQQHPRRPAEVGAGQHGVAVADDLEARRLLAQRGLDLVGDALLVPRLAGNVHQRRGQCDRIGTQVQAHSASRLVQ